VDEHQLVVVQDEVVKLRHPVERVIAYPCQSVAGGMHGQCTDESGHEKNKINRKRKNESEDKKLFIHCV